MKPLHSDSVSGLSDRNRWKFMKYIWKSGKVHNYITSERTHHTWFVSLYQCRNQRFNITVIWEGRKYGLADCMFGRECTWFTVKLKRYAHRLVCLVLVNKWKWICIINMKVDLYHLFTHILQCCFTSTGAVNVLSLLCAQEPLQYVSYNTCNTNVPGLVHPSQQDFHRQQGRLTRALLITETELNSLHIAFMNRIFLIKMFIH